MGLRGWDGDRVWPGDRPQAARQKQPTFINNLPPSSILPDCQLNLLFSRTRTKSTPYSPSPTVFCSNVTALQPLPSRKMRGAKSKEPEAEIGTSQRVQSGVPNGYLICQSTFISEVESVFPPFLRSCVLNVKDWSSCERQMGTKSEHLLECAAQSSSFRGRKRKGRDVVGVEGRRRRLRNGPKDQVMGGAEERGKGREESERGRREEDVRVGVL